jgi:hypothetical protein
MALCPTCGSPVKGDLCTTCGARVGSGLFSLMTSKKNNDPLYWLFGGCLALILISVYISRFDPALINYNPSMLSNQFKRPDWLPLYPGAKGEEIKPNSINGKVGSFELETTDSAEKVASFYEGVFKKEGFIVEIFAQPIPGMKQRIHIAARDIKRRRYAHVYAYYLPVSGSNERKKVEIHFGN